MILPTGGVERRAHKKMMPGHTQGEALRGDTTVIPDVWLPPRESPQLNLDEVHVWGADLDVSPQCLGILRQTLDEAELARAAQFAFERDRRNFVAAHGMLRAVLGRHLAVEPGRYGSPTARTESPPWRTGRTRDIFASTCPTPAPWLSTR